jgi:transcriptional regulator with XRE-family HTH domain
MTFGKHLKSLRESRDPKLSLRGLAKAVGLTASYLSQLESDSAKPPSEKAVRLLAEVLGEDPDVLLAMAGRVSEDLKEVIMRRPRLFSSLLRELKEAPDSAVLRVVREVRDGKW